MWYRRSVPMNIARRIKPRHPNYSRFRWRVGTDFSTFTSHVTQKRDLICKSGSDERKNISETFFLQYLSDSEKGKLQAQNCRREIWKNIWAVISSAAVESGKYDAQNICLFTYYVSSQQCVFFPWRNVFFSPKQCVPTPQRSTDGKKRIVVFPNI